MPGSHSEPLHSYFTHSDNTLIMSPSGLWPIRNREKGLVEEGILNLPTEAVAFVFCQALFLGLLT